MEDMRTGFRLLSLPLRLRRRSDPASVVAYGGWALLSVLFILGTLLSLGQAEMAARRVVLARAEAGAAALEQTTLRVLESVTALENLAQARIRLARDGDTKVADFLEQQMRQTVASSAFGLRDVEIIAGDGTVTWTSHEGGSAVAFNPAALGNSRAVDDQDVLIIPPGASNAQLPVMIIMRPLLDLSGRRSATMAVAVDAIALSAAVAHESSGGMGMIQRRSDGAILARTFRPRLAFAEKIAPDDPLLVAARKAESGQLAYQVGNVDRLIGWRAPKDAPVIVSQLFDTDVALADFFRLRRIVLTVIAALIIGALIATRLVLANFLLRQRLAEQAMRDSLTGLYNRRYFAEVMAKRVASAAHEGKTAAVLLVDLDGFKQINDTRGHPVGDGLLQEVAIRMLRCVSDTDTVMRLGGDEFAVVRIGRPQKRDVTALARFLVSELSRVFEVDGYHLRIAGSVGLAMPPEGGEDVNTLLRSADIALYFVKSHGGDAYRLFDPSMEEIVRTRRALEIDLREALGRGELELYYQPLVQLEPRRVSGFEALLRWHHPSLGLVMPGRFIAIAEETGMISDIGAWAIKRACQEAMTWPEGTRIAVNLSPVQFERSDLVDIVTTALRETKLPASRLELEITEGVVMRDIGDALATMHKLKALGVRLALDDFGTGYASLSYLRSFPFDKVKIDGSFLADLAGDGGTIVRAMLGLCSHLHLDTLVEGVETTAQLDWLRREGCSEVQGHLFSPPKPGSGSLAIIAAVASRTEQMVL